jgi:hypothetical protein
MTRDEMNGRSMKKIKGRIAPLLAVLAAAPMATACAGAFEADAGASPFEPRVQALVDANRAYPRWEDFPRASTDLPTAAEIAGRVEVLTAANAGLSGEVSRLEWSLDDPAAFETQVRQRLAAIPPSPDALRTAQQLEAWAAELRRLGEAPPPIPRHR